MTSSPVKSLFAVTIRSICAILTAALLAPTVGWAQTDQPSGGTAPPGIGSPVRLAPPKMLKPPTRIVPSPATTGQPPATTTAQPPVATVQPPTLQPLVPVIPSPPGAAGDAVQTDTLKGIDADATGVLSEEQGGFGLAMWEGASRGLVDTLLPRLPVNAASSAMRDLMHRLLLSTASVPVGESKGGSLVVLRARLLAAMGDNAGMNELLDATPGRQRNEMLVRLEADSRFLSNDNARACALAAGQITENDNSYWQKAFIFCQALAGEHDKAQLGVALLRELGEDDPVFFQLVDVLAGGSARTIDSLPDPSPLHLAMARIAKVQLPADVIAANRPGILRTIATSPNAPVGLRLEAGERAQGANALPIGTLRQLYTSVSFSKEELANPLSKAEAESGPLSRALLYRTALIQTVPTAQAEVVTRAFALAREGGRYGPTVRVFMPILVQIPPSAELVWFAPEALRALLVGNETEHARVWFALLRASARFDTESATALNNLMPVARLANSPQARDPDAGNLMAWWAGIREMEDAVERATLLYSLFDALGEPVPPELWEPLLDGPERTTVAMPRPALWYRLAEVARPGPDGGSGRVGQTVLLSLLALGEGGPAQADPVLLHRVLASLRAVGLEKEARALAVEAAVAAGL